MKEIPVLWKKSTSSLGADAEEVTQKEAANLLEEAGLNILPLILIQVGAHRSGTVNLLNGILLHYMPRD